MKKCEQLKKEAQDEVAERPDYKLHGPRFKFGASPNMPRMVDAGHRVMNMNMN